MSKMYGVDVSSVQGRYNINSKAAGIVPDFVIVKASQGTTYVNEFCDYVAQQCIKKGLPWGFYHYFDGSGYKSEIDYFLRNTWHGYGRKGIPFFDWETGNSRAAYNSAFGNGNYLKNAADYFHSKTDVWPVIYTTAGVASAQLAGTGIFKNCALWCAGYPYENNSWSLPPFIYTLPKGATMIIWQFDSAGGFDKNVAYIDKSTWRKYADPSSKSSGHSSGGNSASPKKSKPSSGYSTKDKTIYAMASDVMAGRVGSGANRAQSLGSFAVAVQAVVNERLGAISASSAHAIIKSEVLKGHLGNGSNRKAVLGSYYNIIQGLINSKN